MLQVLACDILFACREKLQTGEGAPKDLSCQNVLDNAFGIRCMIQLQKAILEKNFAIIFWLHVTSCLLVTLTFYYYVCQSLLQNKL